MSKKQSDKGTKKRVKATAGPTAKKSTRSKETSVDGRVAGSFVRREKEILRRRA